MKKIINYFFYFSGRLVGGLNIYLLKTYIERYIYYEVSVAYVVGKIWRAKAS